MHANELHERQTSLVELELELKLEGKGGKIEMLQKRSTAGWVNHNKYDCKSHFYAEGELLSYNWILDTPPTQ